MDSERWAPIISKRIGASPPTRRLADGGSHRNKGSSSASSRVSNASGSPLTNDPSSTFSATASLDSPASPLRFSTLHRPFMGTSTRFRNPNLHGNVAITRADLLHLEKEFLAHSPAGRINDHLCIAMTRVFRWLVDRAFRERYIHRATMLKVVAMAPPAAGAVAAYIRMMLAPRKRLDTAPFVYADATHGAGLPATRAGMAAGSGDEPREAANTADGTATLSNGTTTAMKRASHATQHNSYADELRGLFTQSECHAVHYQILLSMADITPLERGLVLLLQAMQFCVFLPMFLLYPRMAFRLMGYMAEESSVVWTQMVNDIDLGKIAEHHVPELALSYWGLQARFVAQEALVPAVIPPKPSMAAALVQEEGEREGEAEGDRITTDEARQTPTPWQPPTHEADAEEEAASSSQASPSSTNMRFALPKFKKFTTRSRDEAYAAAQMRRAALDGNRLTLRDVVLLIRSDEMVFRDLNHRTADALDRGPHEPGVIASYIRNYKRKG